MNVQRDALLAELESIEGSGLEENAALMEFTRSLIDQVAASPPPPVEDAQTPITLRIGVHTAHVTADLDRPGMWRLSMRMNYGNQREPRVVGVGAIASRENALRLAFILSDAMESYGAAAVLTWVKGKKS